MLPFVAYKMRWPMSKIHFGLCTASAIAGDKHWRGKHIDTPRPCKTGKYTPICESRVSNRLQK